MSTPEDFITRIETATADTPYVISRTKNGFTMSLDLADAQWYTLFYKKGLTKTVRFLVSLHPEDQVLKITDEVRSLRWAGGLGGSGPTAPPVLSGSGSISRGRVVNFSSSTQYGLDARTGKLGKVVDYTYNTGEGHAIIRAVAEDAGWTEKMPGSAKGALIVAVGTAVALVVVGIVVGAVALFG